MKKPKIPPHNTQRRTRAFLKTFENNIERKKHSEDPQICSYHGSYIFPAPRSKDVVLVLSPGCLTVPPIISSSGYCDRNPYSGETGLTDTPAWVRRREGPASEGYLGESPSDASAIYYSIICVDGEERGTRDHDVGTGFIFLPNPGNLRRFLELLREFPKEVFIQNIEDRMAQYYASLKGR